MENFYLLHLERKEIKLFASEYREVDFAAYCPKCVHEKKTESDRPCGWCLSMPTNLYTDKPTGFEAKKNGK